MGGVGGGGAGNWVWEWGVGVWLWFGGEMLLFEIIVAKEGEKNDEEEQNKLSN